MITPVADNPQVTDDMQGTPLFRARGLSKQYRDGTLALDRVDLDVITGEIVSLLGPSGCGKSTLMRILAGLSPATGGRLERPGLADADGQISVVFQDPTLMPWARIAENVALPFHLGTARPPMDEDARVAAALERVGLAGFEDRFPRQLSGGMRMRAALARALVTDPAVILMDEPFGALDEITRNDLNDDLLAIRQAHAMTVVFVTHSVSEAVYLSDRIVVMSPRPGRIYEIIRVPREGPRSAAFRHGEDFLRIAAQVSASLKACMT